MERSINSHDMHLCYERACVCVCVCVQRAGQRKKCASCHIVIHTGCMARLDQVSYSADAAAAAAAGAGAAVTDADAIKERSYHSSHLISSHLV